MIDEIERDRDPTFDMDDESISDSEVESGDSDNDSDDSDVNSDRFNSDDDYVTSREMQTPDTNKIRLLQKRAWTETLKRPRSHSLENSSW